jgi:probable HAF family extracellular repeat protein
MRYRIAIVVILLLALGFAPGAGTLPVAAQGEPAYTVTDLGTIGGDCFPADINLRGQVVGTCLETTGSGQVYRAFLYRNGAMTPLGTLGGDYSYAYTINLAGDIAGDSETADGLQHAFLWKKGAMSDLDTLGGGRSQANGINSRGMVVGWSYPATGPYHAFLYENGVMTDIGVGDGWSIATDINELGRVVGYYQSGGTTLPFLWLRGTATTLPTLGGSSNGASRINLFGAVAGWSGDAGGVVHPVVFRGAAITDLGTLGGTEGSAWGINDRGDVVGYSLTNGGARHAFLYRGGALHDLNDLIPPSAGIELMAASGIDDLGRIIANGCSGGQVTGSSCDGGQIRAVLLRPEGGGLP